MNKTLKKFLHSKSCAIILLKKLPVAVKHWDVNEGSESGRDRYLLSVHVRKFEVGRDQVCN